MKIFLVMLLLIGNASFGHWISQSEEQKLREGKLEIKVWKNKPKCQINSLEVCRKIMPGMYLSSKQLKTLQINGKLVSLGKSLKYAPCSDDEQCKADLLKPGRCNEGYMAMMKRNWVLPGSETYCQELLKGE